MKTKIIFLGLLIFVIACKLDNIHEDLEMISTAAPEAAFQVINNECDIPCEISFVNNSTDATIFEWQFGDGNTSTEREPTHSYTTSGSYPVKLTASNASNQIDSITNIVVVTDPDCLVVPNFEITTDPDCKAPCTVSFTNTSANATSYEWDLVIGTSTNAGNFSRVFDKPGDYNIVLTASDGTCESSITKSISIGWHTFTRTYGGNFWESGVAVKQTADGQYILLGNRFGGGIFAYNLIKVNEAGSEEWSNTFERTASNVRETSNGDLVVAARQLSGSGYIKTDPFGNLNRAQTWQADATHDALQISSQTHLGVGSKADGGNEDVYLVIYSQLGATTEIGHYSYGENGDEKGFSFQQTSDGGFIITGSTTSGSTGGIDVYLLKVNSSYDEEWSTTFGTTSNESGQEIQLTNDNGYIIIGTTTSGPGGENIYVIKTNNSGQEQWIHTYGGTGSDQGTSIYPTDDGGFIIAGTTNSEGAGSDDIILLKIDADGTEMWRQTYGGNNSDEGASVVQTTDGGFAILGTTSSEGAGLDDMYFIKTDNLGNTE